MVASIRRLPGTPGTERSDRSRRQLTVTATVGVLPDGAAELAGVDGDVDGEAVDALVASGWTGAACSSRLAARRAAVRSIEADAGGVGGGGLDGLVGRRGPAAEDDEPDEEHEGGHADRGLDGGRPALVPRRAQLMVRSASPRAPRRSARTTGVQPGMTLRLCPRTVTVAVVAVRLAVAVAPASTSSPPASSTNALAALDAVGLAAVLARRRPGRPPARRRSPPCGRGRTARPASRGTSPRRGQAAG